MDDQLSIKKTRLSIIMATICMALPPNEVSMSELTAIGRIIAEAPKGEAAKDAGGEGGPLDILFEREAKWVIAEEAKAKAAIEAATGAN